MVGRYGLQIKENGGSAACGYVGGYFPRKYADTIATPIRDYMLARKRRALGFTMLI